MKARDLARLAILLLGISTAMYGDETSNQRRQIFPIAGGDGGSARPVVILASKGEFFSKNWTQRLSLYISTAPGDPLYECKTPDVCNYIEYYPRLAKVESDHKVKTIIISYLLGIDGLDPNELVMVVARGGDVVIAKAAVVYNEQLGKDEMQAMHLSGPMNADLRKIAMVEWKRILGKWEEESKRVEANEPTEGKEPTWTPNAGSVERVAICNAARSFVMKNYVSETTLPKPLVFEVQRMKVLGNYCSFEGVPIFKDGSPVATKYMMDILLEFGLENNHGKWRVVFDISSTDVPSEGELKEMRRGLPKDYPLGLLPEFWLRKLEMSQP